MNKKTILIIMLFVMGFLYADYVRSLSTIEYGKYLKSDEIVKNAIKNKLKCKNKKQYMEGNFEIHTKIELNGSIVFVEIKDGVIIC